MSDEGYQDALLAALLGEDDAQEDARLGVGLFSRAASLSRT